MAQAQLKDRWTVDAFTESVLFAMVARTPIAVAALVRGGLVLMLHRRPGVGPI